MNKTVQIVAVFLVSCFVGACQDGAPKTLEQNSAKGTTKNQNLSELVGCYSIEKDAPAQFYITEQGGHFFMQMQEKTGGWDAAEALDNSGVDAGWSHFSVNALGLNQSDMQAILVRPDGVMALGMANPAVVGINPNMDSRFVINIFGAVNTIYRIDCGNRLTS